MKRNCQKDAASSFHISARLLFYALFLAAFLPTLLLAQMVEKKATFTPSLWLRPSSLDHGSLQKNTNAFIGNYIVPDQEQLLKQIEESFVTTRLQSIFIVLVPRFEKAEDKIYMRLGHVQIGDRESKNVYIVEELDYTKDKPFMLAFRSQYTPAFGKGMPQGVSYYNKELFEIAELIVYDFLLSDDEVRFVESYLALKYSINISENKTARYRNYFTSTNHYQWLSETESRYNKHVIGLGRLDVRQFSQSQTYTNDATPFSASLEGFSARGEMRSVDMADSSFVVLSKSEDKVSEKCTFLDDEVPFYGWKIKLLNWHSEAKYLHFAHSCEQSAMKKLGQDSVLLTDGVSNYKLSISSSKSKQEVRIPLALLKNDRNYYFLPQTAKNSCDKIVEFVRDTINQELALLTNESALPLQLRLNNLSTNKGEDFTISDPYSIVKLGANGQYQLECYSAYNDLVTSLVLDVHGISSSQQSTTFFTTNTISNINNGFLKNELIKKIEGSGLVAFPNPTTENTLVTFHLLNPEEGKYTIRVLDASGRVLHNEESAFSTDKNQWYYTFKTAGSYTVVFAINQTQLTQTIILK